MWALTLPRYGNGRTNDRNYCGYCATFASGCAAIFVFYMVGKRMTEYKKARAWREARGLSRERLADLTGYAPETIRKYEQGVTPRRSWSKTNMVQPERPITETPLGEYAWQRYKRVCQAVELEMRHGSGFEWDAPSLR